MRLLIATLLVVTCGMMASGQIKATRYNIDYDSNAFPQDTARLALTSVIKALNERRVDYLLAQLTDPEFVDDQVSKVHGGKFEALVGVVKNKFANDPELIKNLTRFSKEGDWDIGETAASAKLKDLREKIFLRKIDSRWYFENKKNAADKPAEEKKDDKKADKDEKKEK